MDIGIDLGTTFSVLAVAGRAEMSPDYPPGRYLEECDATIIPTPEGEETFPSVMVEDPDNPGTFLFSHEALRRVEDGATPVMFSKRHIGTAEQYPLLTRTVTAADSAREFLKYLKKCAETALSQNVQRAVVTHPAYFELAAIVATRQAAIDAGFDMRLSEQMLMEPVAAALAYVRTDSRDPLKILTYDLGGGTFDVTCLERTGGVIEMKAFGGDHLLGGYNFDREILNWFFQRLQQQGRRFKIDESNPEDRGRLAQLLRVSESVKIELAKAASDSVPIDFRIRGILRDLEGKPIQANERVTRAEFVAMIEPFLKRTLDCCLDVLQKAGMKAEELDEVLLVGGSSYGPWVTSRLQQQFPTAKPRLFSPDLCVGVGAALHAHAALPGLVSGESLSLTLDVPERTGLQRIGIAGQFHKAGQPLVSPQARLTLTGEVIEQVELSLDAEGRFVFPDVEVEEDQTNQFHLTLRDDKQTTLMSHTFSIIQTTESGHTSTVTTVMPRPLNVETVDGLVPIAGEGQPLPAKISATFIRANNNPNMTLRLIQEDQEVGEISIENIPPEAGTGSRVRLDVVVSADNWLRGTAFIHDPKDKPLYEAPVRIQFRIAPVPALQAMTEELAHCRRILEADQQPPLTDLIRAKAEALVQEADRLLQQIPVERQEVQAHLVALRRILTPPTDVLRPPSEEMLNAIRDSRLLIARKLGDSPAHEGNGSGDGVAATLRKESAARDQRLRRLGEALDRLEERALKAMEQRDLRSWAHVFDDLRQLRASLDQSGGGTLPTFLAKLVVRHRINDFMEQLATRLEEIEEAGKLRNWQNAIVDLRDAIQVILRAIAAIDDDLPDNQGMAQIQKVMRDGQLAALEQRLNSMGGADIAKA